MKQETQFIKYKWHSIGSTGARVHSLTSNASTRHLLELAGRRHPLLAQKFNKGFRFVLFDKISIRLTIATVSPWNHAMRRPHKGYGFSDWPKSRPHSTIYTSTKEHADFLFSQEFGLSNNLKKHRQLERMKSCRREAHDWRRHVKALCRDDVAWSELVAELKAEVASLL